jgi:hypothetical protein
MPFEIVDALAESPIAHRPIVAGTLRVP